MSRFFAAAVFAFLLGTSLFKADPIPQNHFMMVDISGIVCDSKQKLQTIVDASARSPEEGHQQFFDYSAKVDDNGMSSCVIVHLTKGWWVGMPEELGIWYGVVQSYHAAAIPLSTIGQRQLWYLLAVPVGPPSKGT